MGHPQNRRRAKFVLALSACLLTACSTSTPPSPVTVSEASAPKFSMASDPQHCLSAIECSRKTARTLLFVYDYAALGAPLMQRTGNQLVSPTDLTRRQWPLVRIQLADAGQSFQFRSSCLQRQCRYSQEDLLQIYRRYLAGEPCVLPGDPRRHCEPTP